MNIIDLPTAARITGRSVDTIRQWITDGDLPAVHVPARVARQHGLKPGRWVHQEDVLRVEAQRYRSRHRVASRS